MKIFKHTLVFILLFSVGIGASVANIHLNIVGRVETGLLMDQSVELNIKMDTGAKTAALSAHDIKIFEKDGKEWVSFTVDSSHVKKEYHFEYPLKRMVRIKNRQAEASSTGQAFERRPVIEMELCLNKEVKLIEVSLNDRSNFLYPMLLGRTAMEQFAILIDPTAIYTTKPMCKTKEASSESKSTPEPKAP